MSLVLRALFVLLSAMLAMPASAKERSDVRIGVGGNYPPFSFIDENNRVQGFEIDLANALCARMKVRCEFVKQDWGDMIPALLANRFDAILSSMSITEERKKKVDFTRRYYQSPGSFATRKAANLRDTSPAAMKGRLVGAQEHTIHSEYLEKVYAPAGAQVKLYASQQEAQLELARGRLDAMLADKVGIFEWIRKTEQGECCTLTGEDLTDKAYVGEGVGIAVRKGDRDLKERFDLAIDAILADGTYKKINDKYFPFSIY
jgi:lysine-arginine-ornithine-binding protein